VETSLERRAGLIVETSRGLDEIYVNGREPVDESLPIRLSMKGICRLEPRRYAIDLQWQADRPIPAGWRPFYHFVDTKGEILFQAFSEPGDFTSRQGTIAMRAVVSIPEQYQAGQSFELRYGIHNPGSPQRLQLAGPDDGTQRIRLGTIGLEGQQGELTGVSWSDYHAAPDALLARQNPQAKPIDFGELVTAGGCRIRRLGSRLEITPLPQSSGGHFVARLRWDRLPWKLPEPQSVERLGIDGQVLGKEPVRRDSDAAVPITIPAAEFAWRIGGREDK
jgi:hypothetical protein